MQEKSYQSFISCHHNKRFKSDILANARYAQGLFSEKLDTSDFILITTQILKDIPTQDGQLLNLAKITQKYLWIEQYDAVVKDILKHAKGVSQALYNDLSMIAKNIQKHDVPERDYSRRYFETKLGRSSWNYMNHSEKTEDFYKILTLLNIFMRDSLQSIQRIESDTQVLDVLSELAEKSEFRVLVKELKDIAKRIKPKSKLCDVEKVIDEITASQVLNNIRSFAENDIKTIAKMEKIARQFILSTKDRQIKDQAHINSNPIIGQQSHLNNLEDQHVIKSYAPGIMVSLQPLPLDMLREKPAKNLVDNFRIDYTLKGFSSQHTRCPFVNSISGTTVEFAIILYEFLSVSFKKMEAKHKDIFEHSVISSCLDLFNEEFTKPLILGFVSFLLKNGYHSLYEMRAALNDKLPAEVCKMFNIENTYIFPPSLIQSSFEQAQGYACIIRNKDIVLNQVKQHKPALQLLQ